MLPPERQQHKRTKSSSVIKSIIAPKAHKRNPSQDTYGSTQVSQQIESPYGYGNSSTPMLPADHPHSGQSVLGEIANHGNGPATPRKSTQEARGRPDGPYTRQKSSESTAMLEKDGRRSRRQKDDTKPKKSKSSTNLTNLFSKNRSSKDLTQLAKQPRDKENTTPPSSATANTAPTTPIWAQFASQQLGVQEHSTTQKIPLNDEWTRADTELYTPQDYSPSKQKDYFGVEEPRLAKRTMRPKSVEMGLSSAKAFFQPISSKSSDEHRQKNNQEDKPKRRPEVPKLDTHQNDRTKLTGNATTPASPAKKGSRVMAAVAAFNGKAKDAEAEFAMDQKSLDAAFEAVLDSRNIPEPMRQKMRTLKASVKMDFIRSDKVDGAPTPTEATSPEKIANRDDTRSGSKKFTKSKGSSKNAEAIDDGDLDDRPMTPKRGRPRSRTFTFSKGDSSPSKKHKGGERDASTHRRDKSVDIPKSPSTTSLSASRHAETSTRSQKTTAPSEFVQYLHNTPKPQDIEVGRLHKLRLLLRNETVAWVDSFICEGGMTEIVALLHRIMEIEWREEHDDALLHEALLCLKGLCTTALAQQKLCEVETTLFPSLLGMLFDKERKGPSEFNTRGIIVSLLFTHLCSASSAQLPSRARAILSYLRDPAPPEGSGPLPFVLDMHQPRPYRVWCKEIVDVTKEVFWIFLHQLNVISLPSNAATVEPKARHFPPPRPPVPAAPYVGGVEWDATNYLASHLDLLNGLLASLPAQGERNELRKLTRDSGFEKVMGGNLRTCKEKFYGSVHCALRTWVAAAHDDEWDIKDVRFGPKLDEPKSVKSSPKKKAGEKMEKAPQLEVPKTDLSPLGGELGLEIPSGVVMMKETENLPDGLTTDNWTFEV
ncbi:hypothetical protein NA57DRAFT_30165 [Rhizodiscina lignyota]|uniref:Formin GTPase-binding domain-containing protein n=1 Tax=Rhizodiscina lignyota TaxID=1504668 RepID=A0A9P4MBE1_9PEZI|nr:hypothetical protein NA57DRAFT_30165 [Rhizodiscina lignyota]